MSVDTIKIQLSLAQADSLKNNLKMISDAIQALAVEEVRPVSVEEDLLIDAMSWMYIEIVGELNHVDKEAVNKQKESYNRYYLSELERKSIDN